MKFLVIVDMQNDFITGALANKEAEIAVPNICDLIKNEKFDKIILTRDTHRTDYLDTYEGKRLPVEHCIEGTWGWCVEDRIFKAVRNSGMHFEQTNKPTFGCPEVIYDALTKFHNWQEIKDADITFVGTCTDICVISNVLGLKAKLPDANFKVIGSLCAGVTPESHKAALQVMKSCQVEVIE